MTTRRTFLAELAAAGATLLAGPGDLLARGKRARVVLVRCPTLALKGHAAANRAQVRRMLEVGLCKLAGKRDVRAALAGWVRPVDTVGLKVNCLAGRQMSTHRELVEELVGLLQRAGLPRRRALVFDRADADLRHGGFPLRTNGGDYRCAGNDRIGYDKALTVMPSGASRFARAATRLSSVLINIPVLKDHGIAGVTAALKNNFGLIHNPNKMHLNGCDPHVSEVNKANGILRKQRLVVCDALRVQVDGGPAFHPAGVAAFRGLLLATDPVALDTIAWGILERLRKKRRLPSLTANGRRPVHILTAARRGIGVGDRRRIQLIEVKV